MLVLTNDTFTFTVPDTVARRCGTLQHALEAQEDTGPHGASPVPLPLPNVASSDLVRMVQFYTHLDGLKRVDTSAEKVEAWKTSFFEVMTRAELYPMIEAANYLAATELFDAACDHVAGLIRGCGPEEIRHILMLPQDMTAEEQRAQAEEFAWAIK